MSLDYDRYNNQRPPYYSGYFNIGPLRIPPLLPFTGMVDRVSGVTYFIGYNPGTLLVSLSTTQPPGINVRVYQAYDGPYLAYGQRLFVSSGALAIDQPPSSGNQSAPVWMYNTVTPLLEVYPESTGYPAPQPPVIPGVPSSSPVPTGGGYAAFNAAQPPTPPNAPPFLTVILTAGNVPNLAWWNGTAWVTPLGVAITGIIQP